MDTFTSQDVLKEVMDLYPDGRINSLTPDRLTCLLFMIDWLTVLKTDYPSTNTWHYDDNGLAPDSDIFLITATLNELPSSVKRMVHHVVNSTMLLEDSAFYQTVQGMYPLLMTRKPGGYLDFQGLAYRWHRSWKDSAHD